MLRRPYKTILLLLAVVVLGLLVAGSLVLYSTSPIDPNVLEVLNPGVVNGVFRCEVVDLFNSANRFDRYEISRDDGEVLVEIHVGLRRNSGHPDGFDRVQINLEPSDRIVILTDGTKERVVWSK
ncbi:MAG TPA: hypothetical protein PKN33_16755 [Phycisphaerae bacterium]|nr:hypothetical protein [Phycisphaerae bacterium]